jgi:branched-chain amino acid aminotransferase
MTHVVSIDGVVVAPEAAVVSVRDRGFLYGDGVFETIRVYGGKAFALGRHMARLASSAAALRLPMPVSPDVVAREVEAAIAASGELEATARVTITGGPQDEPGLARRDGAHATRVILVDPLVPPPRAIYADGLRAITLAWTRTLDPPPAAAAKALPYVTPILAIEEARARGADDAIFVDGGLVREATTSNVVLVREDGVLATPPSGPGVLPGITCAQLLDLACDLGLSCAVGMVTTRELASAREVFLASTVRELAPVVAIDGNPVGDGKPGQVTRTLHRALRVRAGARWAAPWE